MKKSLQKIGMVSALSLASFSVLSASAMGMPYMMNNATPDEIATRQTQMFTSQASLIGATVDEVKNAWASGKDFKTLAKEKGITEEQLRTKMETKRTDEMKTTLATLVSKGVITQAQADKRLATMSAKASNEKGAGKRGRGHMSGFAGMMGGGF